MNVLHLHPQTDTGGQSVAAKRVLEGAGDSVRVFVHRPHPFQYESAQMWNDDEVHDSYRWADVVVVHNDPTIFEGPHKNVVVHHHGSTFRRNPATIFEQAEAIGARQVVSTIDLLLSVPHGKRAEWFPQVVDVELMAEMRRTHERKLPHRPRVAHAPTNRQIKGTRYVVRVMRKLRNEADFVLIQRQPWRTCLQLKASADIFVDQLILGYGNNAIEAWAMGLPVLSGASPDIIARMKREYPLPFYRTTPDSLLYDLHAFITHPKMWNQWAKRGQEHVERFHAPDAWVERTRRIYSGEMETAAA